MGCIAFGAIQGRRVRGLKSEGLGMEQSAEALHQWGGSPYWKNARPFATIKTVEILGAGMESAVLGTVPRTGDRSLILS
jgi:hypothetical protein